MIQELAGGWLGGGQTAPGTRPRSPIVVVHGGPATPPPGGHSHSLGSARSQSPYYPAVFLTRRPPPRAASIAPPPVLRTTSPFHQLGLLQSDLVGTCNGTGWLLQRLATAAARCASTATAVAAAEPVGGSAAAQRAACAAEAGCTWVGDVSVCEPDLEALDDGLFDPNDVSASLLVCRPVAPGPEFVGM